MSKKILGLAVFSVLMIFSTGKVDAMTLNENGNYVNLNNIEITSSEKEKLLNLGFTEEQIETMDNIEFNNNKNLAGQVVAKQLNTINQL